MCLRGNLFLDTVFLDAGGILFPESSLLGVSKPLQTSADLSSFRIYILIPAGVGESFIFACTGLHNCLRI